MVGVLEETGRGRGLAWGLRTSVPIVVGYLPAALAFGIAARQAGLGPAEAVLMSLLIYSGASQFALLGLLAAGASWAAMLAVTLVLNLRHLFYGPSLAPRLGAIGPWRAAVAAFGLDDEVFAVALVGMPEERKLGWLLGLELGAYASWSLGTLAGAVAGDAITGALPSLAPALSFALPALFVALLAPLISPGGDADAGCARRAPVLGAVVAATSVAAAFHLAGLGSWGIIAAGVAGPALGLILGRSRGRNGGR